MHVNREKVTYGTRGSFNNIKIISHKRYSKNYHYFFLVIYVGQTKISLFDVTNLIVL